MRYSTSPKTEMLSRRAHGLSPACAGSPGDRPRSSRSGHFTGTGRTGARCGIRGMYHAPSTPVAPALSLVERQTPLQEDYCEFGCGRKIICY